MNFPVRNATSRRTRGLLIVAIAPVLIWFIALLFVTLWSTDSLWAERLIGHGGLVFLLTYFVFVPLGLLSLLALPFSLFLDWRKWKKNNLQK
jgi:hypothetical protein